MGVIGTVLWLFGGSMDARADNPVAVAVVGLHAEQQSEDAGQVLTAAVDALPLMQAVPYSKVLSELSGAGARIVTDALQAEGLTLLAEGRVLFEQAELESAKTRIADSVVALEAALAGGQDSRALMDALLVQANIAIAMGDSSTAARAFKQAVRLDRRLKLDPVHYPPKMVHLFDEVREDVLAVPAGSIRLAAVGRDTVVYVDGRSVGRGLTEIVDVVSGRHHVLTLGSGGDRHYGVVHVPPGAAAEFEHDPRGHFIGGAAVSDTEKAVLTRQLYSSLSSTWANRVVLVAGETGVDEVGIQLYEPRTGRFSIAHRAASNGDPVAAVQALLPQIEGMCGADGSLAPELVSDESLSLDINQNPTLSSMLFTSMTEPAPVGGLVATPQKRTPEVQSDGRSGRIHWTVWAGAGIVVAGATTAALLLRDAGPESSSSDVSDGTGTVLVRF